MSQGSIFYSIQYSFSPPDSSLSCSFKDYNTINITSTEKSNNIIEIQAFPESNDILSLKDLYLTFAVGDSAINMVKDTITSGEQISGVGYKVTSSYSNGKLIRG